MVIGACGPVISHRAVKVAVALSTITGRADRSSGQARRARRALRFRIERHVPRGHVERPGR